MRKQNYYYANFRNQFDGSDTLRRVYGDRVPVDVVEKLVAARYTPRDDMVANNALQKRVKRVKCLICYKMTNLL